MKAKLESDAIYITAETPKETLAVVSIGQTNNEAELGTTPSGKIVLRLPYETNDFDLKEYIDDDEPVRGLADAGVPK